MTGTQAFQFDIHAIIQLVVWGLVLVAVASAFINLGGGKMRNMRAAPPVETSAVERLPNEDRVREIVREEIAKALRPIDAERPSAHSKDATSA
jgi:hypothetical protein